MQRLAFANNAHIIDGEKIERPHALYMVYLSFLGDDMFLDHFAQITLAKVLDTLFAQP